MRGSRAGSLASVQLGMVNVLKAIFPMLMLSVRYPRFDRYV
jgi:hypothetical protein